jgi:hypothetical protein
LAEEATVEATVAALRKAPLRYWKAKDLLRASGLRLLRTDNVHVAKDFRKVLRGGKPRNGCA